MRGLLGFLIGVVVWGVGQPAPAHAGPKQKLVVLSAEPQDSTDAKSVARTVALAKAMTETLRTTAAESGLYEIPQAANKDLMELKLLSDCMDEKPDCMSAIGKDLDVEVLVYGHVQRKKDNYILTLAAMNVATKKLVGQKSKQIPVAQATDDEIRKLTPQMFLETLGVPMETQLVVSSNAEGATVSVGGQARGTINGGQLLIRGLPEGKVVVAIEGAGFVRAEGSASLRIGASTKLEVNAEKQPVVEKPVVKPPPLVPPKPEPAKDEVSRPGGAYRALFWTSLILTGAGATAFTITGLKVSSAEKDQDAAIMSWGNGYLANGLQHPNDACAEAENDGFQELIDICDRGKSAAKMSNIFLGVTAVGVIATGFFLWKGYLSPPKAGKRETGVTVLPEIYRKGAGIGATIQF